MMPRSIDDQNGLLPGEDASDQDDAASARASRISTAIGARILDCDHDHPPRVTVLWADAIRIADEQRAGSWSMWGGRITVSVIVPDADDGDPVKVTGSTVIVDGLAFSVGVIR